jgi:hypothetical protein
VLSFEPSTAGYHAYRNDYVLLIDEGSHNTFLNNAGGSAIDVWRGPAGSAARYVAPARGCIDAFDLIHAQTCAFASAALLDTGSDDTFGQLQPPDPQTDGQCTAGVVEPRVFVQGTGVAGAGILIDQGNHNSFTGKVLTDGTGHMTASSWRPARCPPFRRCRDSIWTVSTCSARSMTPGGSSPQPRVPGAGW